jgi:hypothetical protein
LIFWHAAVPFTFRIQVSHQTQEPPFNSSRLNRGYNRAPHGARALVATSETHSRMSSWRSPTCHWVRVARVNSRAARTEVRDRENRRCRNKGTANHRLDPGLYDVQQGTAIREKRQGPVRVIAMSESLTV